MFDGIQPSLNGVLVIVKDELHLLKDRKRRPEEGEWEPQISFEIFDHCSNINPQKAYTKDLMTTTLEKGGCSLGTQRVTLLQHGDIVTPTCVTIG